jgi:uncharacterized protein (TIGR02145 family)
MPIKRIKAQSPDPYLGKIKGDTELARLAHLNNIVDQINQAGIAGAYATIQEDGTSLPQQSTINFIGDGVSVSDVAGKTVINISGGGGGSLTVNDNGPINNLYITFNSASVSESYDPNTNTYGIAYTPEEYDPGYNVYRAKIATESVAWPGYGYLYNWYAVTDARKLENPAGGTGLTAPNEWRVPSDTDWTTLETFAGGSSVAGGKLKSTLNSTAYPFYGWGSNSGATDDYNFGALGGGSRDNFSNAFGGISFSGIYWTSTPVSSRAYVKIFNAYGNQIITGDLYLNQGCSVRLVREATASELLLADGDTSDTSSLDPYTGNDGKTYVTVKIGTQIWLAQNLRETRYDDNSDIFNASAFGGGDNGAWEAKGIAQEGAWTAYLYINPNGSSSEIPYNPSTLTTFYNDVLENTFGQDLIWIANNPEFGNPEYSLTKTDVSQWKKTHIEITQNYDSSDNLEKNLSIYSAYTGTYNLVFKPYARDNNGALTFQNLNNYQIGNDAFPYLYIEIIEYVPDTPYYYSGGLFSGIGITNFEEELELLTYEINGVTYTEDPEVKRLSNIYVEIYKKLGIELNPTSV